MATFVNDNAHAPTGNGNNAANVTMMMVSWPPLNGPNPLPSRRCRSPAPASQESSVDRV
jgi:hypothetical protein